MTPPSELPIIPEAPMQTAVDDVKPTRDECATEGCYRAATESFESGGVGSRYCTACAANVRQLASPAPAVDVSKVATMNEEATHRHKKSGTEYVLIGIGKMQSERWYDPSKTISTAKVDMREVAIYRSATDPTEIWVRPREEFEDGRFEVLAPQPSSTDSEVKL